MSEFPDAFEAVEVGESFTLDGTYEVTEAEIIEFAEQYDPQPFHVDPEAAEGSMFGGLVASGWHVCAMGMRLLVDGFLTETGSMGAVDIQDLRWHEPVRPGDVLRAEVEVVDKQPWFGDKGIVRSRVDLYTEDALVLSYEGRVLWDREPDQ